MVIMSEMMHNNSVFISQIFFITIFYCYNGWRCRGKFLFRASMLWEDRAGDVLPDSIIYMKISLFLIMTYFQFTLVLKLLISWYEGIGDFAIELIWASLSASFWRRSKMRFNYEKWESINPYCTNLSIVAQKILHFYQWIFWKFTSSSRAVIRTWLLSAFIRILKYSALEIPYIKFTW